MTWLLWARFVVLGALGGAVALLLWIAWKERV